MRSAPTCFSMGAGSADHKISPAAAIYPDAATVVSPGRALCARRTTPLVYHPHAAPGVRRTVIPSAVLRRAGDGPAARTAWTRSIGVDDKVCPAAAVHPDAATVISPGTALPTGRTAALAHHLHPAPRIHRAIIPFPVIRRAGDGLLCPCRPSCHRDQPGDAQYRNIQPSHSHSSPLPPGILHPKSIQSRNARGECDEKMARQRPFSGRYAGTTSCRWRSR